MFPLEKQMTCLHNFTDKQAKTKNKQLDRQLLKYQKVIFMFAVLGHVQLKLDNNNRCYQKKKKFFVYKL